MSSQRAIDLLSRLDRLGVSTLVSEFEDQRPQARTRRAEVLSELYAAEHRRRGVFIGITGTPGAGKSTLLGELARRLLAADSELRVAVLAVDPSSHISGGALLGDRTRVRVDSREGRFYFRSQASQTQLGGLSPASFDVCRLLTHLYDCIFVETVGVGQSEVDIRFLADRVYLVMTPLGGDEVQFLKAGVMEIPDSVILNKSDAKQAARKAYYSLKASLQLARPFDGDQVHIFRTSCTTGEGLDELAAHVRQQVVVLGPGSDLTSAAQRTHDREAYFYRRWVEREWGRQGARYLEDQLGGAAQFLEESRGYDQAQTDFGERFVAALARR
ncbi:MAG: ArgK/MeaB family GTPase [Polyangiaceae bacterium]